MFRPFRFETVCLDSQACTRALPSPVTLALGPSPKALLVTVALLGSQPERQGPLRATHACDGSGVRPRSSTSALRLKRNVSAVGSPPPPHATHAASSAGSPPTSVSPSPMLSTAPPGSPPVHFANVSSFPMLSDASSAYASFCANAAYPAPAPTHGAYRS